MVWQLEADEVLSLARHWLWLKFRSTDVQEQMSHDKNPRDHFQIVETKNLQMMRQDYERQGQLWGLLLTSGDTLS